ncbi:DnaJ domain-containing protein, partial [Nocardioides sp. GCM10030258]|uniref:DnaJ domain-containing protein n=3 Tax=Nocardioides TaxID=1839 RepID=UPI00361C6052
MSVNNYDLLNVDESATADEIRAAWKVAIADLDPSDRRFRAYNDAAGVLLDEDKRASYDAGLAEARLEAEAEAEA